MSLYMGIADSFAKHGGFFDEPHADKLCLMCSKKIEYPFIYWMSDPEIFVHPECCRSLCIRLLRDVWEWECKTGRT